MSSETFVFLKLSGSHLDVNITDAANLEHDNRDKQKTAGRDSS